ncbi:hypothetical protein [Crocosphaera chwakensis]|uniref:Uncharacterized protein n=1 Tax=Crocosphaera chwakensis CCY0110 TaxID=391612 RepID=A3IUD7_9CHRO|nr:hypothetical protein [Crocosphaera chwakensis]EAZ89918.1 hypothetical protein CY0110_14018 [Crocosphaera chwakensis CCY0110]
MRLTQKLFSITGLSTFITVLISAGMVRAIPPCYMVNQAGQTIDLSSICNPNRVTNQPQETQEQQSSFNGRVPVNNQMVPQANRNYNGVSRYGNSAGNQTYYGNNFPDNNQLLDLPNSTPGQTTFGQEISPAGVDSGIINFGNDPISSYNSLPFTTTRPESLRNVSSQYVLNGQGVLELRYYNLSE